jgi:hypothetical protein
MTTLVENQNTSFKSQFDLVKGGEKSDGFMKNDYSFLSEPTTYGREEVSIKTMHPFNYMNRFKNNETMQVNRRDNTIIINDYHSNIVGQYAKKKEEQKSLFDNVKNPNALAGDTQIVDKISLDRFTSSLQYKANDFPENTNIRPESIDGVKMTELVRPREKSLEQLRGEGINSIRLAPEGRLNETTAPITGGKSTDPKTINITKFKIKSYREQNSVEDLLKTTGQITRPEWRSMVKQTNSDRSYMASIDGPSVAPVMKQTYHSDQAARPTNRTDYEDNVHIMNAANTVGGMPEMRNEQLAKPTNRTDYEDNIHISNAVSSVGGREEFRNEQLAKPTYRTSYENNTHITNAGTFVPNAEYRNEQLAKPTIRTDYENNTNIINSKSFVPNAEYRNEQLANPTYRTDYEHNTNITNAGSFVPNAEYRNENLAKPTYRTDYENNTFTGHGSNSSVGYVYENYQSAKPTLRTDYENNTFTGHGSNSNAGYVYENNQVANATHRTDYEDKSAVGPGYNQTNSQYKKYDDITRSGVVEEVLARDYKGADFSFVPRQEDRTQAVNMIQNQSVEDSIDLTKRKLMSGGTDRIPQGRENIGLYTDRDRREKMPPITNRVRNVTVNYIQEVPETRGYNLLEERSNINQYVPEVINKNPFINNVVYTTNAPRDIIRENTFIYDRNNDRE